MSLLKAPTPGGPSITPPSVHGFHPDPKMVGAFVGSAILAIIVIKLYNAIPKWLLLIIVPGLLIAAGIAAVKIGGFQLGR